MIDYDDAFVATETEAIEILTKAKEFADVIEHWAAHSAALLKITVPASYSRAHSTCRSLNSPANPTSKRRSRQASPQCKRSSEMLLDFTLQQDVSVPKPQN